MVYHFIEALGQENLVDENTAKCLYTGIMTDTGGFRYRSTSATTHRIIANLIEKGANPAEISSNTWDNNTVSRLKLLSLILGRVELVKDNEVVVLWLKRTELKEFGFEKGDTDGFVNYGLSLAGVKVSAFFMEDLYEDFIKISFRSKEDVDVNQFARKYFNGGGHINAAGGKYLKSLEETISDFKKIVENKEFNDLEGNDAIVFMGHGTESEADYAYQKLQEEYLKAGKNNIFIATVEGKVTIEDIIEKMKEKDFKRILLKPLMIVAGDHAKNDMSSDDEDSWKTILKNEGYEVTAVLKGMGEYEFIRKMFMDKLEAVYLA